MILAYVLSFSLLIMSVIKVTGLFTHGSKNLESTQKEFIKDTRKTHNTGSITLMAAMLTMMISLLLLFFALKFKVELQEARFRKDSYLCFNNLNIKTSNYITDMTRFNWALRSAYIATYSLVATAEALAVFKALKIARDVVHYNYLKELISNSVCKDKIPPVSYLKNLPYKTNMAFKLNTLIDGTTIVRENKWSLTYLKKPKGIRLSRVFLLKAELELNGSFVPDFKIKTKEQAVPDFSKLNYLFGSL